jgi:hypothetical protein
MGMEYEYSVTVLRQSITIMSQNWDVINKVMQPLIIFVLDFVPKLRWDIIYCAN